MQNSHLKIPLTAHKNCNCDHQAQTNTTVTLSPIKIESYKIHAKNSKYYVLTTYFNEKY